MNKVMLKPFAYIAHVYNPEFGEDHIWTVYVHLDRDTGKFCEMHSHDGVPQQIMDQAIKQAQKVWEMNYGQDEPRQRQAW